MDQQFRAVLVGEATMHIKEFREKKEEVEARLLYLIKTEVEKFVAAVEGEIEVSSVTVDMVALQEVGQRQRRYVVSDVHLRVDLE